MGFSGVSDECIGICLVGSVLGSDLVLVEGSLLSGVDSALSCPLLYSQRVNGAVCEHGLPAGLGAGAGKTV